jgi:hypothetical protein
MQPVDQQMKKLRLMDQKGQLVMIMPAVVMLW